MEVMFNSQIESLSTSPLQFSYENAATDNFLDVYSIVFLFSSASFARHNPLTNHKPMEV